MPAKGWTDKQVRRKNVTKGATKKAKGHLVGGTFALKKFEELTQEEGEIIVQACFIVGHTDWPLTVGSARKLIAHYIERPSGEAMIFVTPSVAFEVEQVAEVQGISTRCLVDYILDALADLLSKNTILDPFRPNPLTKPSPPVDPDIDNRKALPCRQYAYNRMAKEAHGLNVTISCLFEDAFQRLKPRIRRMWLTEGDIAVMPGVTTALTARAAEARKSA